MKIVLTCGEASQEPALMHGILTCRLCAASRWATAVTKAAPLLLPLSERTNLTWHSGSSRRTTLWRRLEYLELEKMLCLTPLGRLQQLIEVFNPLILTLDVVFCEPLHVFLDKSPLQHQHDNRDDLLRVLLVQGPVHTHGDLQLLQFTVGLNSSQDGRQTCGHQVGRPEGHDGADVLNGNTVVIRRG